MPGTVEIDLILKGEQAEAKAASIDRSFDNIGKAGQSGANQARAGLNNLEKASASTAVSARQLDQIYQNVVRTQGASSKTAMELAAALGIETQAAQAATVAQSANVAVNEELAAASSLSAAQMIRAGVAVDKLAGISVAGGRALGVLASTFSAASLGQFAMIIGAGLLIGKLVELARAKEEQIKIDQDQITADLNRADVQAREIRTQGDLIASMRILANGRKEYERLTRELAEAESFLEIQGLQTGKMVDASGHVYEIVARNAGDLQQQIGQVNTELGEQDKTLQPTIATIRRYADAHGLTTDQVLETSGAVHRFAANDLAFMRQQLAATTPFVQELSDALAHLAVPRFDMSRTGAGIQKQQEAVLAGLTALDKKGFTGSDVTVGLSPTLRPLIEDMKKGSASVAEFHSQIQALNPAVREQVQAMIAMDKASKDAFATHRSGAGAIRATANELVNLRKRAEESEAALTADSAQKRIQRIQADIQAERDHLAINKRDREAALEFLARTEKAMIQAVLNDETRQRSLALEKQRDDRLHMQTKELDDLRKHLSHQRQVREEMEAQFLKEEAKRADEARSDRPGRAQTQADEIARQTAALNQVQSAFGGAAQSARMYQLQLDLAAGKSVSTGQVVKAMFAEMFLTVQAAMAWFSALGNAFGNLFEGLVEGGRSAKALFYDFLASILQAIGQMAIAVGTVFLFLPGHTGLGIGLIAAGVAAMALAGVFRGLASNAQKAADAKNSSAGAGSTAAAGGASQGAPRSPTVIPFPTSGGGRNSAPVTVVIQPEAATWSKLIKDGGVVTIEGARGKHNRALKRALA